MTTLPHTFTHDTGNTPTYSYVLIVVFVVFPCYVKCISILFHIYFFRLGFTKFMQPSLRCIGTFDGLSMDSYSIPVFIVCIVFSSFSVACSCNYLHCVAKNITKTYLNSSIIYFKVDNASL